MRHLINELSTLFGHESSPIVSEYINLQYQRVATLHDAKFSLFDIEDEELLTRQIVSFIKECDLTLIELVDHCSIIPSVDSSLQNLIARIIIKPSFFESILVDVTELSFSQVTEGDDFECYTTDTHPLHTVRNNGGDEAIAVYLQGTTHSTKQLFSCVFKHVEIIELKKLLETTLFPNLDVLCHREVKDFLYTALFLRFISEPSFFALKQVISTDIFNKIETIKNYFNLMFSATVENNIVYSSWGKPIATKVIRHKIDSKASASTKPNSPTVLEAVNTNDEYLDCERVIDTWGKF